MSLNHDCDVIWRAIVQRIKVKILEGVVNTPSRRWGLRFFVFLFLFFCHGNTAEEKWIKKPMRYCDAEAMAVIKYFVTNWAIAEKFVLPSKRRLDFYTFFGKIGHWISRTFVFFDTDFQKNSTQVPKIQPFGSPQSGFPGKNSKIVSRMPDLLSTMHCHSLWGGGVYLE